MGLMNNVAGMIVTGGLSIVMLIIFFVNLMCYQVKLAERIPDNRQEIATTCYVKEHVQANLTKSKVVQANLTKSKVEIATYDGYIYVDNEKKDVNKVDEHDYKVKVSYEYYIPGMWYFSGSAKPTKELWVDKKDYFPYRTLREVSQVLDKKRKGCK